MKQFRVGAAQVDITPPPGTQIAGDIGRYRPVEEIRDPLFVKALVLEAGGRRFCLVVFDLTIVSTQWATRIREEAAARFGLEVGAISVCATQTHSAPALGHTFTEEPCDNIPEELNWLRGGDDAFHLLAVERALQAIGEAIAALQPVTVGAISSIEARVAFNRRFVMRDGSGRTHPSTADPQIRYNEGPTDPELGIVCFRNNEEQVIAALLHYTCHPNHGYPKNYISADWPGAWSDGVRELLGAGCVPIVINGCCGNIHHHDHLNPYQVEDYRTMGVMLTETTASILPNIEYREVDIFDWRDEHLAIPWREFAPDVMPNAHKLIEEHPTPMWTNEEHTTVSWDWVYAISLLDLEKRMQGTTSFDYEIQAVRIGDIAFAALPGEPFVEGQLRIKLESPAYPTYIAHMANVYAGYIPTPEALKRGGYETNPGNWSKLPANALDTIADTTVRMLGELFADVKRG